MAGLYDYYKSLCRCDGEHRSTAGDVGLYDYYRAYCVCEDELYLLGMRDLDDQETSNYPVDVYNVNEALIGQAANKAQYIAVWNSDAANQAIGTLGSGTGPFSFRLRLNDGQIAPPWVIGVPAELADGIYVIQYGTEYE
jgi:hypothetical protein